MSTMTTQQIQARAVEMVNKTGGITLSGLLQKLSAEAGKKVGSSVLFEGEGDARKLLPELQEQMDCFGYQAPEATMRFFLVPAGTDIFIPDAEEQASEGGEDQMEVVTETVLPESLFAGYFVRSLGVNSQVSFRDTVEEATGAFHNLRGEGVYAQIYGAIPLEVSYTCTVKPLPQPVDDPKASANDDADTPEEDEEEQDS